MSTKKSILLVAITLLAFGLFFAFQKAQAGVPGVEVSKSATGKFGCSYDWTIDKQAPTDLITLSPGQPYSIPYKIVMTRTEACSYRVVGEVWIDNFTGAPITVNGVVDELDDGTDVTPFNCRLVGVGPVTLSSELPNNGRISCEYRALDLDGDEKQNTVTFDTSAGSFSETVGFSFTEPIAEDYKCATVTDPKMGDPVEVCVTTTLTYNYTVDPATLVCGDNFIDNKASFVSLQGPGKSGKKEGSDTTTVQIHVDCEGGCSLTPGYWKTHSDYGPAPYDDTWAALPNDEDTPFFLSGKTYYLALWTPPQGNAYWILAHAYIAARLNQLNGADFTAAQAAFTSATALFSNPTFTPAYIGGLSGGNQIRKDFLRYATILDNYNNGLIGPGHCSE